MRVVICGGGVIGAATAYFLSRRNVEVIVVERTGIACAASGKSGGFLAYDWCDGSALGPLARRSFDLHAELAPATGADWGYRRLDTLGVAASARGSLGGHDVCDPPDWLANSAAVHARLGSTETTGQVDPARFTHALMRAAMDNGAHMHIGRITGVTLDADGSTATGVDVNGQAMHADAVVIAMGPWSVLACDWLPIPPVYGLMGHSVVFRPASPASPHALFVDLQDKNGATHAPEVFPRPDGTTYVCGLPGQNDLPVDPADVVTTPAATAELRRITRIFAPGLARGEIVAAQACHRPVAADGLPLLGPVPGIANAYIATGHSCWGILNAPASGEAMAELIIDGTTSAVDIAPFHPSRLAHHSVRRRGASV